MLLLKIPIASFSEHTILYIKNKKDLGEIAKGLEHTRTNFFVQIFYLLPGNNRGDNEKHHFDEHNIRPAHPAE